ncbi:hypothetical protein [Pseudonocardia sp.]|uniref:hypothetical protein n=1 Tax=Pseudonocardia sp. TaxID=60912 RepID=UPI003D10E48E
MTERHGGPAEGPAGTTAEGEEPVEAVEALTALRSIWAVGQQSGADLDEARPKAKVCRNMKNIGFGGISGEDVEGSTAVPVGEDMRSAWRDLLRSEGKFHPGASPTSATTDRR